jgi:SET domain-containing protein
MPPLPGLQVVHSRIHGYGVVANRPFVAGEVIADVDGVALRLEEVVDDEYCLWVTDELYFDMVDQTRWINHSCSPNGEVQTDVDDHGNVSARIVALRDIAPGEEISYDYEFAVEFAIPCHCASPQCRGLIIDPAACV